jgi:hypothetical protein
VVTREDWRAEKRFAIAERIARSEVFVRDSFASPTGRYRLVVSEAEGPDSGWNYSLGNVVRSDGARIATVERNYSAFPFTWVESHPNGHDYLICGEDYQGQTIIELDTARRIDRLGQDARAGTEFCWAAHYASLDRRFLAVDGCFWACPYELVIFDFVDPMKLPYLELARGSVSEVLEGGFSADGSISWSSTATVRKSDGKPLDDLDESENEALLDEERRYRMELLINVVTKRTWRPDGSMTIQLAPKPDA